MAEVPRLIDESVWTICEVVSRAVVPSTVSKPEGDSVLLCENEMVCCCPWMQQAPTSAGRLSGLIMLPVSCV